VEYRKAFKYMSWKGWTSGGEPDEPAFQEPELLANALGALGKKVETTIEDLCKELSFKPETFRAITQITVPRSHPTPAVIPFSR
jgi:hypothetical protein